MVESKRKSRQLVLRCLYEADFKNNISEKTLISIFERSSSPSYCVNTLTQKQTEYAKFLIHIIVYKFKFLKFYINNFSSNHDFIKLSLIDRNILLIALAEIFYTKTYNIPVEFVIEEASSLGNMYGSNKSMGLINALLRKILRKCRIQNKKRKENKKNYISGIIYAQEEKELYYLLVKDFSNKWRIIRTINEKDESSVMYFLIDKIKTITGADCKIEKENIAAYSYYLHIPEEGRVKIKSNVALLKTEKKQIIEIDQKTHTLQDARWFSINEIKMLPMYSDIKKLLLTYIEKQKI